MPEAFIFWTFLGPGLIVGGSIAIAKGHYILGVVLILVGMFFTWARFRLHKPKQHAYTIKNCPLKGSLPAHGVLKIGYHWYKFSIGEDDNTMVECTFCGYSTTAKHINPLTQINVPRLGLKLYPELLPAHP